MKQIPANKYEWKDKDQNIKKSCSRFIKML